MKKAFSVLLTSFAFFSLIACAGNESHSVESNKSIESVAPITSNSEIISKSNEPASSIDPISSIKPVESSNPVSSSKPVESSSPISSSIAKKYHVRFANFDNSLLFEQDVDEGSDASYGGETPEKAEDDEFTYEFDGWDQELTNIQSDTTFVAQYKAIAKVNWGPITWF